MFALSSVDVFYLVKELRSLLVDSFVDKFYQSSGDVLIKLRNPRSGKHQLLISLPNAVCLTNHRFDWPKIPPGFCMLLRKHLSNSKLVSVEQHGFERIIELRFVKGEVSWLLILEVFSKGNVVLVNSDNIIRGVLSLQRWKDRTLRVNAPYEYPPPLPVTPSLSLDELSSLFSSSGKPLVKFLATVLGLGGKYAEELVLRSGLDKNSSSLDDDQLSLLHSSLKDFFSQPLNPVFNGSDVAPFPMRSWSSFESLKTFSEGIDLLVVREKSSLAVSQGESVVKSSLNKFDKIIKAQSKKLEEYERQALENQRKGELIYERYQELSSLLSLLRSAHEKGGWPAVKSLINDKGWPIVVNEKKGSVVIDLKDS